MILSARVATILLHTLVWSLLNTLTKGRLTDIYCLKSIKDSLEDPYNYLNSSWNFNNNTEGFICQFTGVECFHADESRVLNIRLSDMRLKGQFPRGIANCTSLTGLDLSSNYLSGPMPSDIAEMTPYLTTLDLSSNRLSGQIPLSLAYCTYLNVLKLDNNQLTGQIPPGFGQLNRIKAFSVSSNSLWGPVPNFVNATAIGSDSYANNKGLCGPPLKDCKGHRKKFDDYFIRGFAVGWVVSAVSVVTSFMLFRMPMVLMKEMKLMILTTMHTMLKMRRKTKRKEAHNHLQEGRTETSILEAFVTRISLRELIRATSNFSEENIIGLGKMGTMYKGVLLNGSLLAVKRFRNFQHFEKQFIYEVRTLGRLRHNNLVPLFGFCAEEEERLLVYKYMASGNLCEWLHPLEADSKFLEWPLRVRIGIGLARGLAWLHHNCKPRVIHGNISSNCILLDQNFEPKLSNFGTSMILKSNDSNSHIGEAHLSESLLNISKEDVYCFGIVLLEMVTGEKPNQVSDASDNFSGTLVEWITHLWDASRPYNAIDKLLAARGFDSEIVQFLKVAYNCVKSSPNERPSMLEVYRILSAIGETYGIANDSEILTGNESGIGNHRNENTRDEIIEVIE